MSFKNDAAQIWKVGGRGLMAWLFTSIFFFVEPFSDLQAAVETGSAKAPEKTASVLFRDSTETFKLRDQNGRTPSFRILADSTPKQALALAVEATLNSQPDVQPKIPVDRHIDLRFESLTFASAGSAPSGDGEDALTLRARISGHDVDVDKPVSRAKFLSGQTIEIRFDPSDRAISLFQVQFQGGSFRFHLDRTANRIIIEDARARATFSAPFGAEGDEAIKFSGFGDRVLR